MVQDKPLVSIIIVNWNGFKWLENCLDSIYSQTYTNFEIIFVDNGSTDESVPFVKKAYPKVVVVKLDKNYGFAKGNSVGIQKSKGDILYLLNNDTTIRKDMLAKVVPLFANDKIGTIQPKIVLMKDHNKLDLVGGFWTPLTFLYYYGLEGNANLHKYNRPLKVFTNKGAAMFIRKDMLEKIGSFDDDFWSYYEETDLCHRAWLSGYECWYYPVSVCYHANGGTSTTFQNSFIQFHNFKNKLLSFLKNFQTRKLLVIVPTYLLIIFCLTVFYLLKGKPDKSMALLKSIKWNIDNLGETLQKRRQIQRNRQVSDSQYLKILQRNLSFSQIISLLSK